VPLTRYDDVRDVVYRCFRIGETALLTPLPLVEAVSNALTNDPFLASMLTGAPAVSEQVSIKESVGPPKERQPITLEGLANYVLRHVPSAPVERYEGTVVEVSGDRVHARLVALGSEEIEWAEFALSRLPGNTYDVRPGTPFVMSAFEQSTKVEASRELRFRLRRVPEIPTALLER
jgi:hypothetical protein